MDKTLYEQDYYLWLEKMVNLLESRQFSELDIGNLIDEISEMTRSQQKALKSNLVVIFWHLLKYLHQPEKQTNSWKLTLFEHRERIEEDLTASPSLKSFLNQEIVEKCYDRAKNKASIETGLRLEVFPAECPFTLEQALDYYFIPNEEN